MEDLTLEQFQERFGLSESAITRSFPRTVKSILKKYGCVVTKEGRGKNAVYHVEEKDWDYVRENTVFLEPEKEIIFLCKDLILQDFEFLLFITLSATPYGCFRGTYGEYLDYIEKPRTKSNRDKLKKARDILVDKNIVLWAEDPCNKELFIAGLSDRGGKLLSLSSNRIKECKRIMKKYKKREWYNIFKVYTILDVIRKDSPELLSGISSKYIGYLLGLSSNQVRDILNILSRENLILKEIAREEATPEQMKRLHTKFINLGFCISMNAIKEI